MRAAHLPRARRRRRARVRLIWQWSLFVAAVLVLGATTLGLAFAGSPERLPAGSADRRRRRLRADRRRGPGMLKQRSRELGRVPVVFTANGKRWRVKPDAVVAEVDWAAAVEAARQPGRGLRADPGPEASRCPGLRRRRRAEGEGLPDRDRLVRDPFRQGGQPAAGRALSPTSRDPRPRSCRAKRARFSTGARRSESSFGR